MLIRLDYLILIATLQDKIIRIILNLKANRSYISLRLENKFAQNRCKKNEPYLLTMANGKPMNHEDE